MVDEAILSRAECDDLGNDLRTKAFAPPTPMKLIDPIESHSVNVGGGGLDQAKYLIFNYKGHKISLI